MQKAAKLAVFCIGCGLNRTMFEYIKDMMNSDFLQNQELLFEAYDRIFVIKNFPVGKP